MSSQSFAIALLIRYGLKFGLAAGIGYGSVWVRRLRQTGRQSNSSGWPSVEGVVVSAKSEPIPKTHLFLATITYSYFVGEYRAGTYTLEFPREEEADEFARSLKDRRLQIRYKESNPDKSVIDPTMLQQLSPLLVRR